ncbi:hypothetical protein M902_1305 [Bacteriovorax sp. BAL6_X]|uniref:hypothetical protein n=1 Tax=Bacteriovorax sp. BAL6_X TaxID=1201290 RepID=UPI000386A34B|nr:hypothetical protein [Bacteriovorax sp. BAL6_X]EPZ50368.1 hypothetical protein M902_1305 [Bacteriovorax sp. BAL6_X]
MFRFLIYFTVSFLILAFPVAKNSTVFDSINKPLKPYTQKVYSTIAFYLNTSLSEGKEMTVKLFNNTAKKVDYVKRESSGITKPIGKRVQGLDALDDYQHGEYTVEEREALLKVLRESE